VLMPPPRVDARAVPVERPPINSHQAQWNVRDDAKLACLQKGTIR
jgi:hypothetical protein